jgi:hypothetical protein
VLGAPVAGFFLEAAQKSEVAIYLVLSMPYMHVRALVAAQKSDIAIYLALSMRFVHVSALVAAQKSDVAIYPVY